jgi:uncharacterized protein YjiS (DUF1127 family)
LHPNSQRLLNANRLRGAIVISDDDHLDKRLDHDWPAAYRVWQLQRHEDSAMKYANSNCIDTPHTGLVLAEKSGSGVASWWVATAAKLELWFQRSRQRSELMRLSGHMLCDVGISRSEAAEEGRKWFWQA